MNAVCRERNRSLEIVVDDEGGRQVTKGTPSLDDQLGRRILQAQLDDCGASSDGGPRRLEIRDDRVQFHEIFVRAASVSGSRL